MSLEAAKLWFNETGVITPVTIGNLNQTFVVKNDKGRFILQRLNPIFAPEVNLDIHALTSHLRARGVGTTTLIPTLEGSLWTELNGGAWRLLSFVEGENFSSLSNALQAQKAGCLVGRFHNAVADFRYEYRFSRGNTHDTKSHLHNLRETLVRNTHHEMIGEVSRFADQILAASHTLSDLSTLTKRHSHGDLKINNLIFSSSSDDHSLIDLDTIGLMPWPLEMGDAFRSWCNPQGEDAQTVTFNEEFFEAAIKSYANLTRHLWSASEVEHLLEGVRTIPLELASRFLRDVIEDKYFGYDSTRFPSRVAHNWLRAKGQLSLYCDIERKKAKLERIIKQAFV